MSAFHFTELNFDLKEAKTTQITELSGSKPNDKDLKDERLMQLPQQTLEIIKQDIKNMFGDQAEMEVTDAKIVGEDYVLLKIPNQMDLDMKKMQIYNIGGESPTIFYNDVSHIGAYSQTLGSQIVYANNKKTGKLEYIGCADALLKAVPLVTPRQKCENVNDGDENDSAPGN